jgi:uncharacterized damage-inducible protein DinB
MGNVAPKEGHLDILDRYLGYEEWTMRYMLVRSKELSQEQLHQPFDIGQGSLHSTVTHIIENIEGWTELMREVPPQQGVPITDNAGVYLARFDAAMADFRACASTLAEQGRLDETFVDVLDKPPVAKPFGAAILHLLTHTTVHRWEVQHILQRLGVPDLIEGDALSWEMKVLPLRK